MIAEPSVRAQEEGSLSVLDKRESVSAGALIGREPDPFGKDEPVAFVGKILDSAPKG